jgi:UTP--glucose-1-phosphate uridylyltransferase
MLPLVDKPVIQYVVEEALAAGLSEVAVVIGDGKQAIQDHFGSPPALRYFVSTVAGRGRRRRTDRAAVRG